MSKTLVYNRLATGEIQDENGITLIHFASSSGDVALLRRLIASRKDINVRDHYQQTPLHLAASVGHEAIVEVLVQSGADKTAVDYLGQTALHRVVSNCNNIGAARLLIDSTISDAINCSPAEVNETSESSDINGRYRIDDLVDFFNCTALDLASENPECRHIAEELSKHGYVHVSELPDDDTFDGFFRASQISPSYELMRRTPLHLSTMSLNLVKRLCELDENCVSVKDIFGNIPLHYVDGKSDDAIEVVQCLAEIAEINFTNNKEQTPLHMACIRMQPDVIEALLSVGADADFRDLYGFSPLHYVVMHQQFPYRTHGKLAELLSEDLSNRLRSEKEENVKYNKNWDEISKILKSVKVNGFSTVTDNNKAQLEYLRCRFLSVHGTVRDAAFKCSIKPGSSEHLRIIRLLLSYDADINCVDRCGRTVLHIAASIGTLSIVQFLLSNNVHHSVSDFFGVTPLYDSVTTGKRDVTELLLGCGAIVNAADRFLRSPLHVAVQLDDLSAVRLLVHHGALTNARDMRGNTPLYYIQERRSMHDMLDVLIVKGKADMNSQNLFGQTVLHVLASNKPPCYSFLDALCLLGADTSISDKHGDTALHVASDAAVAEILLELGIIEVDLRNPKNLRTPLINACLALDPTEENIELVEFLLENGANCNKQDVFGASALHYAVFTSYPEVVEQLLINGAVCNLQISLSKKTPLHLASMNPLMLANENAIQTLCDCTDEDLTDSLGYSWKHNPAILSVVYGNYTKEWTSSDLSKVLELMVRGDANTMLQVLDSNLDLYNVGDNFERTVLHIVCSLSDPYSCKTLSQSAVSKLQKIADKVDFLGRNPLHHVCIMRMDFGEFLQPIFTVDILRSIVNQADKFGRTPIFYAGMNKFWDTEVDKLLDAGADINLPDYDGITALDVFCARQRYSIKQLVGDKHIALTDKKITEPFIRRRNVHTGTIGLLSEVSVFDVWLKEFEHLNSDDVILSLQSCVHQFVETLMHEVSDVDCRFTGVCHLVGSTYRETRTQFPADFDYLIELINFNHIFTVSEDKHSGYAKLTLSSTEVRFQEFTDSQSVLQPLLIKEKFYQIVTQILKKPDLWRESVFEYLSISLKKSKTSPAVTLELAVNHLFHKKSLVVMCENPVVIEFVPAIRLSSEHLQPDTFYAQYVSNQIFDQRKMSPFVVLKSPKVSNFHLPEALFLKTFTVIEAEVIRRSPSCVKAAFVTLLSYFIKHYHLRKDLIPNCVLHCISLGKFDDIEDPNNVTPESLEKTVLILLQSVVVCLLNDHMVSVTDPSSHLPVWDFEPKAGYCKAYMKWQCKLPYVSLFVYQSPSYKRQNQPEPKVTTSFASFIGKYSRPVRDCIKLLLTQTHQISDADTSEYNLWLYQFMISNGIDEEDAKILKKAASIENDDDKINGLVSQKIAEDCEEGHKFMDENMLSMLADQDYINDIDSLSSKINSAWLYTDSPFICAQNYRKESVN